MKNYTITIIAVVLSLLSTAFSAALVPQPSNSLFLDSGAAVESPYGGGSDFYSDWDSSYLDGGSSVTITNESEVPVAEFHSAASSQVNSEGPGNVCIEAHSESEAIMSVVTKGSNAWSGISSVAPGSSTGIFFDIVPSGPEENIGDIVTLHFNINAEVWAQYAEYCRIDGGFAGDQLLITRNCADKDSPLPDEVIWSANRLATTDNEDSYYQDFELTAALGDNIGVHFGIATKAYLTQYDEYSYASANLNISIEPGEVRPYCRADINSDGKVDLLDLAELAQYWLTGTE